MYSLTLKCDTCGTTFAHGIPGSSGDIHWGFFPEEYKPVDGDPVACTVCGETCQITLTKEVDEWYRGHMRAMNQRTFGVLAI